jgi:hypothetical protein
VVQVLALSDEISVPIEIQFMHKLSRRESRVGRDSHVLFKLIKYARNKSNLEFLRSDAAVECIERIHNRKSKLDRSTHDLNGSSLKRANAFERELKRIDADPRHRGIAGTAPCTVAFTIHPVYHPLEFPLYFCYNCRSLIVQR